MEKLVDFPNNNLSPSISLIEWTRDNKIKSLKEFGCNINNYNPYQNSDEPKFRNENINWL